MTLAAAQQGSGEILTHRPGLLMHPHTCRILISRRIFFFLTGLRILITHLWLLATHTPCREGGRQSGGQPQHEDAPQRKNEQEQCAVAAHAQ